MEEETRSGDSTVEHAPPRGVAAAITRSWRTPW
jgi:hypothetical protein